MIYRILADAVVVLHFLFIGFVIFGGLAALRYPRLALVHIPAACWGTLIELTGWLCPLTTWENDFRQAAGEAGYPESFIDHYLIPLIYPEGLTREIQFVLAGVVVAANLTVYGYLCHRRRCRRSI